MASASGYSWETVFSNVAYSGVSNGVTGDGSRAAPSWPGRRGARASADRSVPAARSSATKTAWAWAGVSTPAWCAPWNGTVTRPTGTTGGAGGAHASGKQRLVGVNIAHPHHHMVIHQHGFDWRGFAPAGGKQHLAVKIIRQGLRPQFHQERMQFNRAQAVQDGAKAARVAVAQTVLAQQQIHMVVALGRGVGRQMAQAAGHAQMDDQRGAVVQLDQQVFGAARHLAHAAASQALGQLGVDWPAQARLAQHRAGEDAAGEQGGDAAPGGFHFWQFRHV